MKVIFKNTADVNFTQLKNVVGTDDLRPAMQGVNINLKHSRLEATNAHLLMIYPIEILADSDYDKENDSLIVPVRFFNLLKYMMDIPKKYLSALNYVLTDEFAEVYFGEDLVFRTKYIDAKYPKIESVLPTEEWKGGGVDKIAFNTSVIEKMTKSFPKCFPNNIVFNLYAKNKGVLVESMQEDLKGCKGMIMPIMIHD